MIKTAIFCINDEGQTIANTRILAKLVSVDVQFILVYNDTKISKNKAQLADKDMFFLGVLKMRNFGQNPKRVPFPSFPKSPFFQLEARLENSKCCKILAQMVWMGAQSLTIRHHAIASSKHSFWVKNKNSKQRVKIHSTNYLRLFSAKKHSKKH